MIEVFYTTRDSQVTCDVVRMRLKDDETADQRMDRALAAIRRVAGNSAKFAYIGW